MIQAKLLVIGGEVDTEELVLQLPATIGRSRESTINLSHPLVSRQHCELFEADGCLMVRDLDSLNGTFVGSQRISESVVRPGDLLTVGTVTFRAIYDPAPSTNGDRDSAKAANSDVPRRLDQRPGNAEESEETHRLGERDTLEVRAAIERDEGSDSGADNEELEEQIPRSRSSDH